MEHDDFGRRQVWLSTRDRAYEEKLYQFLTYHYGQRMEVHRSLELAEGFVPDEGSLLLTDRDEEEPARFGETVRLTPGETGGGINVYQSGHEIARQLLRLRGGADSSKEAASAEEQPDLCRARESVFGSAGAGGVFTVCSPVGGCGVSSFAMTLAQCLQENCEGRVLFLAPEPSFPWQLFFRSSAPYNLSDLLYSLLTEEGTGAAWEAELDRVLSRQESGVWFIRPLTSLRDLELLSNRELALLFGKLRKRFAWIVCDPGCCGGSLSEKILELSDRIYLLKRQNPVDDKKTENYLSSLELVPEEGNALRGRMKVMTVRRGRKGQFLPEEKAIFLRKDALLKPDPGTAYYKKVRELAIGDADA